MASSSSLWRRRASGRAELALLLELARGKKTFEDVKVYLAIVCSWVLLGLDVHRHGAHHISTSVDIACPSGVNVSTTQKHVDYQSQLNRASDDHFKAEAQRYAFEAPILRNLIGSHASRTIRGRLEDLTGIGKDSLHYFNIRCKDLNDDTILREKRHPFNLLTSTIKRRLEADPDYFVIAQNADQPDTVASSFVNSPEYTCHELVQQCLARGEVVVPVGVYGDGIAVGVDVHQDSLYIFVVSISVSRCAQNASNDARLNAMLAISAARPRGRSGGPPW